MDRRREYPERELKHSFFSSVQGRQALKFIGDFLRQETDIYVYLCGRVKNFIITDEIRYLSETD